MGLANENVAKVDLGEDAVVRKVVCLVATCDVDSCSVDAKADSRIAAAAVVLFVGHNTQAHNLAIITPGVKAAAVAVPLQRAIGQRLPCITVKIDAALTCEIISNGGDEKSSSSQRMR